MKMLAFAYSEVGRVKIQFVYFRSDKDFFSNPYEKIEILML